MNKLKLKNGDYVEVDDQDRIILHRQVTIPNGEDDYDIEYEPEIIYPKEKC